MTRKEMIEQAAIFREHTKGMTLVYLPVVFVLIGFTMLQLLLFLSTFLAIRRDSSIVFERLDHFFNASIVVTSLVAILYFLLIGVVSFYLLQLVRGERARLFFKDGFSLIFSEWNKPVYMTLLTYFGMHFMAGLPFLYGFAHFMKGLIMNALMILSPGAMAELAQFEPNKMMDLGLSVFLFGFLLYLAVYYTYSQTIYILFDQLDNASFTSPIPILRESRLLMLGNYIKRIRLDLAFIGWFVGCWLTLNLLSIYVLPYYQTCKALFYEEIKNERLSASE
ncbi:TPA: DUF975 family protein [Streptococcus suis]|nr:DUF975 family protein [Streptococcus suis]HEM6221065.1 DUF975 family protein [Streptococcus suis]HEM6345524.1 DUF975 family protein [Streptococcus suis]